MTFYTGGRAVSGSGVCSEAMGDASKRHLLQGRGPASRKFRRRSTTGAAQAGRIAWGQQWGAVAKENAKRLRETGA